MAKGQKRSTREQKKPKKVKAKPSVAAATARPSAMKGGKKK